MRRSLEERFWRNVAITDECWIWTGYCSYQGYGRIWDGESRERPRKLLAHRVAWFLARGAIPDGIEVCHRCDNPSCVRLDHLFLGTHAENMGDMVTKQRQARGARNRRTRLTEVDVLAIRERSATETQRQLAAAFGVGKGTIQTILNRQSWAYI